LRVSILQSAHPTNDRGAPIDADDQHHGAAISGCGTAALKRGAAIVATPLIVLIRSRIVAKRG
jgi:hypothetical protein